MKAKNNIETEQIKFKQTCETSNKGGKEIVDDTLQNKKMDRKIKIKEELIETAVQTQQDATTGDDKESLIIDLLGNSSKPGTVKVVSGAT